MCEMSREDRIRNCEARIREKRAWCRTKIKLLGSIGEKIHKHSGTGDYGLTDPERMVLMDLKKKIEAMPEW